MLIAEVDPPQVTPEDPEEYYDHQLIELDVVTIDGREVGGIGEVSTCRTRTCWWSAAGRRRGAGPVRHRDRAEVDLEAQRVVIDPPGGLIDDRRAPGPSAAAGQRGRRRAGKRVTCGSTSSRSSPSTSNR